MKSLTNCGTFFILSTLFFIKNKKKTKRYQPHKSLYNKYLDLFTSLSVENRFECFQGIVDNPKSKHYICGLKK